MIYKVGLCGASGKMGLEIAGLLAEGFSRGSDALELADAISGSGRLSSIDGVAVRRMEEMREPVHVWIDFSRPSGTLALLEQIDCPVLIGTTGFSETEKERIAAYSQRAPVLFCSNTSPGMALMSRMLRSVTVPDDFAAVLEEDHHRHKKDSPSGSAKFLLQILKTKGHEEVQVHVTRAGSIVGTHTVRFIADGEELSLQHRVSDRKVFAKGALLAALFLAKQKESRLYTMEDLGND